MSKMIDLSHTITDGLQTYKGIPGPVICDFMSRAASREFYAAGTEFHIGKIEMVANTGTYIDCPFHRYEDGKDLSEMPLTWCANLPAIVLHMQNSDRLEIDAQDLQHLEVSGKAVLVHTEWSKHWNTPAYFENHPFLTEQAAMFLRDRGARLVGIDSHNIDDTRERNARPVHSTLLRAEIPIVEHLRGLEQLPSSGFAFSAVPPKIRGMGTFPVRAFAQIP
jgi:kynurenine formamidase